ncbi:MAG: bifunctional folylpolyglutamate synthase/dihydrofolate synthase [Planctomycetes bacterium]|nr:bifunctional folylpolyglutamate synthase/dihydrofolate synthase [Planctomycetota bacterium]
MQHFLKTDDVAPPAPPAPPAQPCSTASDDREQAIEFLLGRINFERSPWVPYGRRQLKLDRMRQLLTRLGNPDVGLPIVHVAGTKGKGSTSALLASVLHAAGYDVGVFSSPHLDCIEERFSVNGQAATGGELAALVQRLRPIVQAMDQEAATSEDVSLSPTYFELTTALALMHFVERQVDVGVLEVGLGGRLDSTNVCQPAVTVITSISFDHTKQLGNTLAEIAAEKAGIVKPGVPVLCGPLTEEPRRVIAEIARQHGCRMLEAGRDFWHSYRPPLDLDQHDGLGQFAFHSQLGDEPLQLTAVTLRMLGEHQAANAALALATAVELRRQGWLISTDAMHEGLGNLTLPARVEVLGRQPTVVLDVAHNVASVRALVEVLLGSFACEQRTLLLAVTRDKDVVGIIRELAPHFHRVVVTEYQENPRAVPTAKLGKLVRAELKRLKRDDVAETVLEEPRPEKAWQLVQATAAPDELVCITGSFFIAAELRRMLLADGSVS